MSQRIGNIIILAVEPDGKCELCGKVDELRPYGPNGERICFDCGMKYERTTTIQMRIKLFGQSKKEAETSATQVLEGK